MPGKALGVPGKGGSSGQEGRICEAEGGGEPAVAGKGRAEEEG